MGLYLTDVYRSPNIGVFIKANDKFVLVPKGLAQTKSEKVRRNLQVPLYYASVGGSRLLGPLVAMNNHGIMVSRMMEDYEINEIASQTSLNVERLNSRYTSVGNLIAVNDKTAIVSPLLDSKSINQIKDLFGTEVERMALHEYALVGAMIVATDSGAAVYPRLEEEEVQKLSALLNVEAYPASVNGGVPFLASGLVANSKNALVGSQTTGPELVFLTRALKV